MTNVVHPLFVEDIFTSHVRGDITTLWVTTTVLTMRVELTTRVISLDTNFCEVSQCHNLDVQRCLHKVNSREGTVRNNTRIVTRLCTPSHCSLFLIRYRQVEIKRTKRTPIVSAVDRGQTRIRRLVHRRIQHRLVRVRRTPGTISHYTWIVTAGVTEVERGRRFRRASGLSHSCSRGILTTLVHHVIVRPVYNSVGHRGQRNRTQ